MVYTYPEHPSSPSVHVTRSLVLCVCFVDRCLSLCPFFSAIVLSVLLRFTDSNYPFGIFKLFLYICQYENPFFHFILPEVHWVQQKIQQLAYVCNGVFFPKKCEWSRLNYLKWLVKGTYIQYWISYFKIWRKKCMVIRHI